MKFEYKKTLFNIDLLVLTKTQTRTMVPVTKLNIFESSSNNFEPNGLFSTGIFGAVGSTERNTTFSYIDLKTSVLHPLIYKHLITTKALYGEVLSGKQYVVYDDKIKDLVPAKENDDGAGTGYSYFMQVLNKLELLDNDSDIRKFKLYMIAKYGTPEYLLKEFLILPAGLRDYIINASGKPEEDEINDMYRRVITLSNALSNITSGKDVSPAADRIRYRIQESILALYEYIMTLLDGKKKFIQGKWGSRGILYGTRNVITPSLSNITDLDSNSNLTVDHTVVGLFQYAYSIMPITMNKIHTTFIGKLFNPDSSAAYLVNTKTLKSELTDISVKDRDVWLTLDGLEAMLGTMGHEDLRSEPVMVNKKYLLVLHDDGKTITPVFNTDNMSDDFNVSNLRPITYYELLYIALVDTFSKYRCLITRYPVINLGGIYPSKIYVRTTNVSRKVIISLGVDTHQVEEYPNFKEAYYNSLSPHSVFLAALGADFDGDKVSFTAVYTDDAISEIDKLMSKKEFYLSPDNRLVFSPDTGTLRYAVASLSKGVIYE